MRPRAVIADRRGSGTLTLGALKTSSRCSASVHVTGRELSEALEPLAIKPGTAGFVAENSGTWSPQM